MGSIVSIVHRDPQDRVQILDEDGTVLDGMEVPDLSDEELVDMYRYMRLARHFDERAVSLNRQGRMGTYPPLSGQEGAQIGSVYALSRRRLDVSELPRTRCGARSRPLAQTDHALLDGPRDRERHPGRVEHLHRRGPDRDTDSARDRRGVGVEAQRRETKRSSVTSATARRAKGTSTKA